jgi:hypothetical protein
VTVPSVRYFVCTGGEFGCERGRKGKGILWALELFHEIARGSPVAGSRPGDWPAEAASCRLCSSRAPVVWVGAIGGEGNAVGDLRFAGKESDASRLKRRFASLTLGICPIPWFPSLTSYMPSPSQHHCCSPAYINCDICPIHSWVPYI